MIKYLEGLAILTILLLLGFTATAHAAAAVDPAIGTAPDIIGAIHSALAGGHYAYVAAMALVGVVALARKYGGARWPALHTDLGSALLACAGAFGTALSASLVSGAGLNWGIVTGAGTVAFGALGGYAAVNALIVKPYLVPLAAKAPSWMQPLLQLALFWFVHQSDPTSAKAAALVSAK